MLFLPEVSTIFIFTPRTGSSTLCAELTKKFPRSFLLYRHMESDGVPEGFQHWRRVGFVRHPLARLWSLYKFCTLAGEAQGQLAAVFPEEAKRVRASIADKSFEEWMLTNEEPFLPSETFIPYLYQRHHMPETKKSGQIYLRPDLGTLTVLKYEDMAKHMEGFGLDPKVRLAATPLDPMVADVAKVKKVERHLRRFFAWEMSLDLKVV